MFINLNRFKTSSVAKAISSLFLDFTATNTLDDRVTFSRTSNATVTRSDGTIGYAPHNLLTFSEQFDNAAWTKNATTVTANSIVAPNGTTTADTLIETATNDLHVTFQTINLTALTAYTITVYLRAGSRNFAMLRVGGGGFPTGPAIKASLTDVGSVSTIEGPVTSSSITSVGSGWYRVSMSFISTATTTGYTPQSGPHDNGSSTTYTGNGTGSVSVWGAQLELGSTATTYNPTTVKNLLGFSELFDNAAWTKSNSFVQTNLLTFSEAFDNAAWNDYRSCSITSNSTTAPNGYDTADKIVEAAATASHFIQRVTNVTTVSGVVYTQLIYAKAAGRNFISVILEAAGGTLGNICRFNLIDGTTTVLGTGCTTTSTQLPNGWWRFTITATSTGTSARLGVGPALDGTTSPSSFQSYAGDGTSGVFIWGAQLVQGAVAGDYRRTDAAALPVYYPNHNGVVVAEKLVQDTANTNHRAIQIVTTVSGTTYTASVYAKAGESTKIGLREAASTTAYASFDLSLGTKLDQGNGGTGTITPVGNGWYRCSLTVAAGGTLFTPSLFILSSSYTTGDVNGTYTGNGTSGIYIFGAQLSDSASLDPYVLTAAAAPTAAAYYGPRFDYDPVTLQPKGLLIEEQRSNLLLQSEAFNTSWSATRANVTANVVISPDGTQDADKLYSDGTASNTHRTAQSTTVTNTTAYTITVYAKASELSWLVLYELGSNAGRYFNLSSGVTGSQYGSNSPTTYTITPVSNGWYRCQITITSVGTTATLQIILANADGGAVFDGDNTSGIYIWGAQLEAGAFATSYIPTVASQVTRTADTATIQGSNFYSWYNQNEGSVYSNSNTFSPANTTCIISINDNTNNNRIQIAITSTSNILRDYIIANSIEQFGIIYSPPLTSANAKQCTAYAVNSFAASINNSPVQIDNLGITPIVNRTSLGFGDGQYLNGTIKQISYYPIRLADTVLQGLTT